MAAENHTLLSIFHCHAIHVIYSAGASLFSTLIQKCWNLDGGQHLSKITGLMALKDHSRSVFTMEIEVLLHNIIKSHAYISCRIPRK